MCADEGVEDDQRLAFALYRALIMFALPTIIMLFCYTAVIYVLWVSSKELVRLTEFNRYVVQRKCHHLPIAYANIDHRNIQHIIYTALGSLIGRASTSRTFGYVTGSRPSNTKYSLKIILVVPSLIVQYYDDRCDEKDVKPKLNNKLNN